MIIPESVIEMVVNHQFSEVINATEKYNSVEISGFGKLLLNKGKAIRRMWKYENTKKLYDRQLLTDLTPAKKRTLESKLKTLTENMEALKPILHED